ncbi:MAG: phage tail protein [Anaerolineae bacterium]|nr:phage tail protein [Anaerolineae bacterium]
MPGSSQRTEVYAAFRFAVQIDGVTEAVFTECTLPTLEVEVLQQMEGGLNSAVHQIPGRVKMGKITLKRGVTTSSDLLLWYMNIAQGQIQDGHRDISVVMYDSQAQEVLRWNFGKAFPIKWTGPNFVSSDSKVAIETLELAYQSMSVGKQ